MQYEMRIDSLGFDVSKSYRNISSFSIGHESCVVKLFEIFRREPLLQFVREQRELGRPVQILTPFVPERHLEEIKRLLDRLFRQECFRDSVVIVNDLGLMRFVNEQDSHRTIRLGRSMIRSLDYTPWGNAIFEAETEEIRRVVSQATFYDDEKMEFFRNFNVSEIEANLTPGTRESLRNVQHNGFRVCVHQDTFLYGTQRSCHVRRRNGSNGSCWTACERPEPIQLVELWAATGNYKKPDSVPFPDPLYLRGNQILGKARDFPPDDFDTIILNEQAFLPDCED